jgi:hypothetical protein
MTIIKNDAFDLEEFLDEDVELSDGRIGSISF